MREGMKMEGAEVKGTALRDRMKFSGFGGVRICSEAELESRCLA